MPILPAFTAATHGFPFPNSWEPGTPVLEVPTPLGTIKLGDASGGVCGGMVFAAADHYLFGKPVPPDRSQSLFRYFCKRLIDSWSLPFGVMKYYNWQCRSGHSNTWFGTRLVSGVTRLTAVEEWPKIRAAIDRGQLAPLGLVQVESWRIQDMVKNHQVLCFGYDAKKDGTAATLHCYDPNWPGHDVTLTLDLSSPDDAKLVEHSVEGTTVRGVFLTDYVRPLALNLDEPEA